MYYRPDLSNMREGLRILNERNATDAEKNAYVQKAIAYSVCTLILSNLNCLKEFSC